MRKEDILQCRPMTKFAFTTAGAVAKAVMVPVEAEFFVEDCGLYRKLRFKCAVTGPGVEVQFGHETKSVHTLDVTQKKKCILSLVKNPFSPLAWWENMWRRTGPTPLIADRLMKIIGSPFLVTLEAPVGTLVAVMQKDIQDAADQYLAGIDFSGWKSTETTFEILVREEDQSYPATITCTRSKGLPCD